MARLRRLAPDSALFRRRAAGEPLRELARDYGVAHTTLGRYFGRPEAVRELQRAARLHRAEQRAADARRRAQERAEREARRRAEQQAAAARAVESAAASRRRDERGADLDRGTAEQAGTVTAASPSPPPGQPDDAGLPASTADSRRAAGRIRRLGRSSAYADWLDERDARLAAPADPRVRLVTASGKTIASTNESNAERAAAALEPCHGPLTIVPA